RSPQYAMLALMSPALAVGTWWEGKRKHKSGTKEEEERYAKALDTFEDDIAKAAAQMRARRREDVPDPATTMRRASLPSTRLRQPVGLGRPLHQRGDAAHPARRHRQPPDPGDAAGPRLRRPHRGPRRAGTRAAGPQPWSLRRRRAARTADPRRRHRPGLDRG